MLNEVQQSSAEEELDLQQQLEMYERVNREMMRELESIEEEMQVKDVQCDAMDTKIARKTAENERLRMELAETKKRVVDVVNAGLSLVKTSAENDIAYIKSVRAQKTANATGAAGVAALNAVVPTEAFSPAADNAKTSTGQQQAKSKRRAVQVKKREDVAGSTDTKNNKSTKKKEKAPPPTSSTVNMQKAWSKCWTSPYPPQ